MIFTQTELSTRVYEYQVDIQENITYGFTLSEITNGDLDNNQNAVLFLFDADNISIENSNNIFLTIVWDWDTINWAKFATNGGILENIIYSFPYGPYNYYGGEIHSWKAINGNLSATLQISVTAEFPDEDSGSIDDLQEQIDALVLQIESLLPQVDMNDDDILNIFDIIALVNVVLDEND